MTTSLAAHQLSLWITCPKAGNPLRQFIAWRKRWRVPGTFAHSHSETTLHRDLSVADNFLLALGEPPSQVPRQEKDAIVHAALERHGLSALSRWFGTQEAFPTNMSPQERAVASICCALLNCADETLVDLTGVRMDELCFHQVREVLAASRRTIIVVTRDEESWQDTLTRTFDPQRADVKIKKTA